MKENELIAALQRGETAPFEEIDRRYRPRLRRFLLGRGLCPERDVDDRVQETLIRAFRQIGDLRKPAYFGPWLFQIGRRICYDANRQKSPRPFADWSENAEKESPQIGDARFGAERELFRQCRERYNLWSAAEEILTEEEFRILWLRYAEKRTDGEIAELIQKNAGNVRVILYRIRKKLARRMKEGGREE